MLKLNVIFRFRSTAGMRIPSMLIFISFCIISAALFISMRHLDFTEKEGRILPLLEMFSVTYESFCKFWKMITMISSPDTPKVTAWICCSLDVLLDCFLARYTVIEWNWIISFSTTSWVKGGGRKVLNPTQIFSFHLPHPLLLNWRWKTYAARFSCESVNLTVKVMIFVFIYPFWHSVEIMINKN